MLSATISRDVLETIVAPVTALDNNQLLRVEPDGIEIHATDKSREAIVEVSASEAAFESYSAESMESGIDFSRVAKFLDIVDDTNLIQIEIDAEQGRVTVTADTLLYTFSLVFPDDVPCAFGSLDSKQPAAVTIRGHRLDVPIELANMAGSHVRLSVDSNSTTFSGITNGVRDTLCFEFGVAEVNRFKGAAVGLSVSLDYFKPIQQVVPADTLVRFELGNRECVRLHYPIAGGAGTVTVTFAGVNL